MAGRKGRSGPPGNLNNSKRPWNTFFRRKAVSSKNRWILRFLEVYAAGLASDKPGLTEAEARLIEIGQISRGATMLILAEVAASGFIVKDGNSWDLSPGAKDLPKFLAIERQALMSLGVERRAKTVPQLHEYISQRSEANTQTQPAPLGPQHKEDLNGNECYDDHQRTERRTGPSSEGSPPRDVEGKE